MNLNRLTIVKFAAAGAVTAVALFGAVSASAQVNWSVGVNAPGVSVGVGEPGRVYYEPGPAYAPPPTVYYQPAPPVYYRPPPPTYYRPAPAYYGPPAPVYYEQGERWRYRHHHRRDWDDRD